MIERIYLDNAATTSLDEKVLNAMMPYLTTGFGNPSSIYSYGRESRIAVESARKKIASLLNTRPAQIFFTSCGTESNNTAIKCAVRDLGCTRIITSKIEHHAVLHTVEYLNSAFKVEVEYVKLLPNGHVDLEDLERLLSSSDKKTLVSLMHANNEIGNLTDINAVGKLCEKYGAFYHADTVQTVGHLSFDLDNTPVHFITGSAHKFHGPKGSGILYIKDSVKINPFIHGGSQERNMRAGTENIYGIVGFASALELAYENLESESKYIAGLKNYMLNSLRTNIPGVTFNGDPEGTSLFTVLSVAIPKSEKSEMLLFNLDINNICASGGSACTSGAEHGSHVIKNINANPDQVTVRFSFSKHNTKSQIDNVVEKLKELI